MDILGSGRRARGWTYRFVHIERLVNTAGLHLYDVYHNSRDCNQPRSKLIFSYKVSRHYITA